PRQHSLTLLPYTTLFRSSDKYTPSEKVYWFHDFMEVRNDPCIVTLYKRLLVAEDSNLIVKLPRFDTEDWYETSLRDVLAQTLFRSEEHTSELQSLAYLVC